MAADRTLKWRCGCVARVEADAIDWQVQCHLHLDEPDDELMAAVDAVQGSLGIASPAAAGGICPDCGGPVSQYSGAGARCRSCYIKASQVGTKDSTAAARARVSRARSLARKKEAAGA